MVSEGGRISGQNTSSLIFCWVCCTVRWAKTKVDARRHRRKYPEMKHKAHLGASTTKTIVVERGLVQRFVEALEITDPICTDQKAADNAGLPGLMLPHTAAGALGDYQFIVDLLELKPKQVLHAQEHLSLFAPLCVGDELSVTTTLRDVYEQQASGNPMGFVVIDVVGAGKKADDVRFEAQRTLVVRGGLPRR